MSAPNINKLLDLWASTLLKHNEPPPFANHLDLYISFTASTEDMSQVA